MYSVTKHIHLCYGHRLLDYQGKCRFLHGHNGLVEVSIARPRLDSRGMAMDFSDISAVLKVWIDAELDHKMILNAKDPLIPLLQKHEQALVLFPGNPTAEALAKHVYDYAKSRSLPVSRVKFWETPSSYAVYEG